MYTKNLLHQYHDLKVISIYTNCHQSHFYYFFRLILQLDILQIDQFIGNGIDSQTCRARTTMEAIMWHGAKQSDARATVEQFRALSKEDRDAIIEFLDAI